MIIECPCVSAHRHFLSAPWPSGKAADCKSATRRFDSDRRLSFDERLCVVAIVVALGAREPADHQKMVRRTLNQVRSGNLERLQHTVNEMWLAVLRILQEANEHVVTGVEVCGEERVQTFR